MTKYFIFVTISGFNVTMLKVGSNRYEHHSQRFNFAENILDSEYSDIKTTMNISHLQHIRK